MKLARMPGISAITVDAPVRLSSLSNRQQWPFVSGVARGWGDIDWGGLARIAAADAGLSP